jgi:hypothetical protein
MIKFTNREVISVEIPDEEDEKYNTSVTAHRYEEDGVFGIRGWRVGGENASNYVTVYDEELDAWIELLTELKRRAS